MMAQINQKGDRSWARKFFSHGPYTQCPKCTLNTFGNPMTGINAEYYMKECYECGHEERYSLPEIKKKIIYLDQFVIDNFVKTLDPKHPKHSVVSQDPFWLEAYKKLDVLSKAHLIVCPDSFYHRDESGPTNYFESMQRIYEHLSGGATFRHEEDITRIQMQKHFRNFLKGKPEIPPETEPREIVLGELNKWRPHIEISINAKPKKEEVEETIKQKEASYASFVPVYKRWQTEKGKKFDDWYEEENGGFGKGTILAVQKFADRRSKLEENFIKTGKVDLSDVLPWPSVELVNVLGSEAMKEGIKDDFEVMKKIVEYLNSKHIGIVPSIRIGSSIYAAIARDAANGRTNLPSKGVFVDLKVISGFLPYCEAMFLDNENAAFLNDHQVKTKIGYSAQVFSRRNKEEFLTYLDDMLANADPAHLETIKKVYGEDYLKPYVKILEQMD